MADHAEAYVASVFLGTISGIAGVWWAMSEKIWKACERRIAKYIGGVRVPITGRQRGDAPDIRHSWLSPEVKYKRKFPDWMHDAMRQAEAAKVGVQLPVVIMAEKGRDAGEAFIMCRLKDFRDHWL